MDVYNFIVDRLGVSAFDALLLVILLYLARSKYLEIAQALDTHHRRLNRIEKSALKAGVELLSLEEE